jgi:hypothetical protein
VWFRGYALPSVLAILVIYTVVVCLVFYISLRAHLDPWN